MAGGQGRGFAKGNVAHSEKIKERKRKGVVLFYAEHEST